MQRRTKTLTLEQYRKRALSFDRLWRNGLEVPKHIHERWIRCWLMSHKRLPELAFLNSQGLKEEQPIDLTLDTPEHRRFVKFLRFSSTYKRSRNPTEKEESEPIE